MEIKIFSALFAVFVIAAQAAGAPLHLAAEKGDTKAIAALIDEGADPNAKDDWGKLPLHWAAENGHVAAITVLLAAGADPFVAYFRPGGGGTPLRAVGEAVIALANAGVDPNVRGASEGLISTGPLW